MDRPASGLPEAVCDRVPGRAGRGAGGECDRGTRRVWVPRVIVPAADWCASRGFDGTLRVLYVTVQRMSVTVQRRTGVTAGGFGPSAAVFLRRRLSTLVSAKQQVSHRLYLTTVGPCCSRHPFPLPERMPLDAGHMKYTPDVLIPSLIFAPFLRNKRIMCTVKSQ